jgi:hypothetical protein
MATCLGHNGNLLAAPVVNIGDAPTLEAGVMTDSSNIPKGGKVGVKTEKDVDGQLAAEQAPAGPMARAELKPVREGAVHGYRGAEEGLVEIVDAEARAKMKAEQAAPVERIESRAKRVTIPDFLADERPAAEKPAKASKAKSAKAESAKAEEAPAAASA